MQVLFRFYLVNKPFKSDVEGFTIKKLEKGFKHFCLELSKAIRAGNQKQVGEFFRPLHQS